MGNEIEATQIYPGKLYPQQNKISSTAGKMARRMRLIWKIKENNRRGISNHDSNVLACILASATHPNLSGQLNFKAAMTTAFSGFLRCGEFTIHSGRNFDPSIHLMRSSMEFIPSFVTPSHVVLTMLASKTDPFRKGVTITIASTPGAHTCAVTALKSLFEYVEWPPESPL